jgi:hypothetical protein
MFVVMYNRIIATSEAQTPGPWRIGFHPAVGGEN